MCTKMTAIGPLLLKLSLVVGWYPFSRQCIYEHRVTVWAARPLDGKLVCQTRAVDRMSVTTYSRRRWRSATTRNTTWPSTVSWRSQQPSCWSSVDLRQPAVVATTTGNGGDGPVNYWPSQTLSPDAGRRRQLSRRPSSAPEVHWRDRRRDHVTNSRWRQRGGATHALCVSLRSSLQRCLFRVTDNTLCERIRDTQGDSDFISSYHIYARHDVGQAVRNVCHCGITFLVRQWQYGHILKPSDSVVFE